MGKRLEQKLHQRQGTDDKQVKATSLVTREIKKKQPTIDYTPIRMSKMKKTSHTKGQ